jgi:hypothetical protein
MSARRMLPDIDLFSLIPSRQVEVITSKALRPQITLFCLSFFDLRILITLWYLETLLVL